MGNKFMLFLLVWYIVVSLVITGAIDALNNANIANLDALIASPWLIIGMQTLGLLLPLFLWIYMKKDSFMANMPRMPLGGTNILIIIMLGFFLQPVMMLVSGISSLFFTNHVSVMMYDFMQQPIWLILLAMAVTPAVIEELVFRGYLQSQHSNFPIKQAALMNGLFFGIIHLNPQQFSYAFVLGVIFAYMVYYTRSIWAGILPHFIFNASQGLLGRWAFSVETETAYAYEAPAEWAFAAENPALAGVLILGIINIFVLPVVIALFVALIKHNKSRVETQQQSPTWAGGTTCSEYSAAEATNWPASYVPPDYSYTNEYPAPEPKPRLFDRYAIAVIAIFIVLSALPYIIPYII